MAGATRDDYVSQVRARVRAGLQERPLSFVDVVRRCDGAYPEVVAGVLAEPEFQSTTATRRQYYMDGPNEAPSALLGLENNPVLCSWYFTRSTCVRLASIRRWTGCRLAFLGAPRLFEVFAQQHRDVACFLYEADERVLSCLAATGKFGDDQLVKYRVPEPVSVDTGVDYVFFDAPWYPADLRAWLRTATALAPKASIAFALFPRLIRPTATRERDDLLDELEARSRNVTLVAEYLEYEIPSFERAELLAAGVDVHEPWKLADLVLVDGLTAPEAWAKETQRVAEWIEVDVGALRVFVDLSRVSTQGDELPLLRPLPDGTIQLRSPSRRDPARQAANVLTSRGHGACTRAPRQFVRTVRRLSETSGDWQAAGLSEVDEPSRRLIEQLLWGAQDGGGTNYE